MAQVLRSAEVDTPLLYHVEKAVLDLLESGHRVQRCAHWLKLYDSRS